MCTAKGSDVRPGVPWGSASFAWQAWDNVRCQGLQGVGCTPWRPSGLRLFCVAGVGQCALPRGRMYTLASLGAPPLLRGRRGTMCTAKGSDVRPGVSRGSASFAWQAWDNVPRGRMYALASLGAPPLLRGRCGTMCTAKGSDVRPGVSWGSASFAWLQAWDNVHSQGVGCTPWRPLGLRRFCVAGVGQCARPRGRMYVLASLGASPLLRSFAWQAWDNVHSQGVGCTPWRPLRRFCVAGVGQCALPRGRMYALASLGAPCLLRGRRGTMCTAKGSDVRPGVPWGSAAFVWEAWDNVRCQGVGCTPWRPLGLRLFCVAGVGQCARPRGRMYVLASLGASLLLRCFCVAGVGQCALPRGRMYALCALPRGRVYALASLGAPPLLRGRRGAMCTAKGRMYALASLGDPPLLRGRRGTMCTSCQGVGCMPWRPLGLRLFCVAGVGNVHCQGVGCTPWRPLGPRLFCVAGVGQ